MGQTKSLIQEIQRGRVFPVYLLHGEETYLIEDALDEMVEALAPKNVRDFNLDIFSDPEVSVAEVLSIADTYPVMAERRVVVVKDPAFLGSGKQIDPVGIFHDSRESHRMGNLARSADLLARALDLDPEEFAEGGTAFKRAIESFKNKNEDELSPEDLEFLEDTASALTTEIEITPFPSATSDLDRLLEYLENGTAPTTVLIFAVTSTLGSNQKVVKVITKIGKVISFGRFRQSRYVNRDPMYQMVVAGLREYKKTIAPDAFIELQKKTGNDMRQTFDELDKLVTFVGEKQRIEKGDVEELVTRTSFDSIFDLTNAISQRSLPLALANLKSVMEKGDHPDVKKRILGIHAMLTRHIRLLLQAKLLLENGDLKPEMARMSSDAFQRSAYKKLPPTLADKLPDSKKLNILKQHPYALHITLRQAGNFTIQELVNAMGRLLEADIQLKTGRLTPELVVEMLVIDLVNNA
jgi:DNA polymerase-3 subunit delta